MIFSSLDNYQQLVRYNKVRLIELLRLIGDLHYDNFQRTNIYSKIVTLERSFTYEEQGILEKEIKCYFNILIENMQKNCPALTLTEILICCLSLRFSVKTISLCFGYSNLTKA
jgi:hypothetical protein